MDIPKKRYTFKPDIINNIGGFRDLLSVADLNSSTVDSKSTYDSPIMSGGGLLSHVVLFESKAFGWIAYATRLSEVKRILKVHDDLFYVFKCDLLTNRDVIMKLKFPLHKYYKSTSVNIYKEETYDGKYLCVLDNKTDYRLEFKTTFC
jgi:hypothetical protein